MRKKSTRGARDALSPAKDREGLATPRAETRGLARADMASRESGRIWTCHSGFFRILLVHAALLAASHSAHDAQLARRVVRC